MQHIELDFYSCRGTFKVVVMDAPWFTTSEYWFSNLILRGALASILEMQQKYHQLIFNPRDLVATRELGALGRQHKRERELGSYGVTLGTKAQLH